LFHFREQLRHRFGDTYKLCLIALDHFSDMAPHVGVHQSDDCNFVVLSQKWKRQYKYEHAKSHIATDLNNLITQREAKDGKLCNQERGYGEERHDASVWIILFIFFGLELFGSGSRRRE
jgi:hypothetical protein